MPETPEIRVDAQYVIGVDPGSTTGVVVWDNVQRSVVIEYADTPKHLLEVFGNLLRDMLYINVRPTLVVERFDFSSDTLRKRDGVDDVINVLGMLWCFSQVNELELHRVARSNSKNFVKDEALKNRSLWLNSRHTRDALRVVFTWLAQTDYDFVKNFWAN